MKIDSYDYYEKIFILCLYMEYMLVLDINYCQPQGFNNY